MFTAWEVGQMGSLGSKEMRREESLGMSRFACGASRWKTCHGDPEEGSGRQRGSV